MKWLAHIGKRQLVDLNPGLLSVDPGELGL